MPGVIVNIFSIVVGVVIQSLSTLEVTVQRHFCSILGHKSSDALFNERRLPNFAYGESILRHRYSLSGLFTPAALSIAALFVRQSYNDDIETSDHDACDHDRVKVAALFYRLHQSGRIFRLDHRAGKHFLAEPSQNRTPERRPSQSHYAECTEVHPNECSRRNNNLAGHRDNRAFHCHEQNDSQIAPLLHPLKPYLNQMLHIVIQSEVEESLDPGRMNSP